jgi:hypothetical protein
MCFKYTIFFLIIYLLLFFNLHYLTMSQIIYIETVKIVVAN